MAGPTKRKPRFSARQGATPPRVAPCGIVNSRTAPKLCLCWCAAEAAKSLGFLLFSPGNQQQHIVVGQGAKPFRIGQMVKSYFFFLGLRFLCGTGTLAGAFVLADCFL
jgi:hypothetical protein